jgi:hypothetical protein
MMGAMRHLREVETDVGESERPPPPRAPWSIMSLSLPLQAAVGLLISTAAAVAYVEHRFGVVDTVVEHQNRDREKAANDKELVAKDFLLRDDRITRLTQRVELLECKADGVKGCGGR